MANDQGSKTQASTNIYWRTSANRPSGLRRWQDESSWMEGPRNSRVSQAHVREQDEHLKVRGSVEFAQESQQIARQESYSLTTFENVKARSFNMVGRLLTQRKCHREWSALTAWKTPITSGSTHILLEMSWGPPQPVIPNSPDRESYSIYCVIFFFNGSLTPTF